MELRIEIGIKVKEWNWNLKIGIFCEMEIRN